MARDIRPADPFERTPPPSRRRPRRPDVVTYRVRVDLEETRPPLWRRLELASDLALDDVHDVIQAAFGWNDSHLHRFGLGPDFYSDETEYYLCPFEVEEGETGIPEEEVHLDEVLVDVGDKLRYNYDFGDDWQHVVNLEAVLDRDDSAPRAACTDGRRPGPAEDCGGVGGYELIVAATEPGHPDHAESMAEFARHYGDEIDPAAIGTTPFDIDEINSLLGELGIGDPPLDASLPEPLDELVRAVQLPSRRRRLRQLIDVARSDGPGEVDAQTAARMVRPYTWLLNRVGTDGIKLTSAGYLPPNHVEAAMAELDMEDEWIGKNNRESDTLPVLDLRESAQKLGLLRKYRGSLLMTSRGRALRDDPVALWWHLAARMPLTSKDAWEAQAGLVLLVVVAGNVASDLDVTVAQFLDAIGWMGYDGLPFTSSMAVAATWDNMVVLRRLGAVEHESPSGGPARPTVEGVTFACAALGEFDMDAVSAGAGRTRGSA